MPAVNQSPGKSGAFCCWSGLYVMRYLSICSGIEAATVAWHALQWHPVAYSEIDPFACALLAHRHGSVANLGDMARFREWQLGAVDLLVGGTPCQSFSTAGLRRGLDDPRGNLTLAYAAIARLHRPRWLVWENVPGVLSADDGRAFATFLGALAKCGYGFTYRVLDAQYFGLAQRRKRVFVVGYFGDWRPPAAVLLERESLCGHSAPRRTKGQDVAGTFGGRTGAGGGLGTDFECGGGLIAGAVSAKWAKGTGGPAGDEAYNLVAHTLRGEACHAGDDGTGRGTPLVPFTFDSDQITRPTSRENPAPGDPCHTLGASSRAPAMASEQTITVRRLTPRECERLQGFPDDYTLVPYRGGLAADSPRYRALGNSMAVPVMRWLGQRILAVDDILMRYRCDATGGLA